jgi:hypothetical protein
VICGGDAINPPTHSPIHPSAYLLMYLIITLLLLLLVSVIRGLDQKCCLLRQRIDLQSSGDRL